MAAAPSPYPNHLQHRELTPGLHETVAKTIKVDPWSLSAATAATGAATATTTVSAFSQQQQQAKTHSRSNHSMLNPSSALMDGATEADRLASEKAARQAQAQAAMAAAAAARTERAVAVIEASGVPLATPPPSTSSYSASPSSSGGHLRDIFQAACDGDVAMLEANLQSGHIDINAIGQPSPVHYNGLQFEKRWTFSAPPIVFAAAFNRERAVRALIKWGAQVDAVSSTGLTAADYARQRGYTAIAELLGDAQQ